MQGKFLGSPRIQKLNGNFLFPRYLHQYIYQLFKKSLPRVVLATTRCSQPPDAKATTRCNMRWVVVSSTRCSVKVGILGKTKVPLSFCLRELSKNFTFEADPLRSRVKHGTLILGEGRVLLRSVHSKSISLSYWYTSMWRTKPSSTENLFL